MAREREIVIEIIPGRVWPLVVLVIMIGVMALASVTRATPDRSPTDVPLAWVASVSGHYYLTDDTWDGKQALGACAEGYHMASLWEILDVSNLTYDTALGYHHTPGDEGEGPPTNVEGWVRTGNAASIGPSQPGMDNCAAWTWHEAGTMGTVVSLPNNWAIPGTTVGLWVAATQDCSSFQHVWCVKPPFRVYLPLVLRNY